MTIEIILMLIMACIAVWGVWRSAYWKREAKELEKISKAFAWASVEILGLSHEQHGTDKYNEVV